jgi:hypothetical protein
MTLIKNQGRHNLPPLRRILSRDSINKIRVIPSIMTRSYKGRKTSPLTLPSIRNSDGTKGTRCVPYSLIVVHEESGDECAHGQLMADRFRLRYRDTSLSTSSEMTRTLPRTESLGVGVAQVLLPAYFRVSSRRRERRRRNSLLGE